VGAPLPIADVTGAINMSGAAGKVALVNSTSSLGCNGSSTPCSDAQTNRIIDLVGYGNANFFEGAAAAPTLSSTAAAVRAGAGCIDTNENGADFSAATPVPRNSASPLTPCTPSDGGGEVDADGDPDASSDADAGSPTVGQCGDPATPIATIQGTTDISPLAGQTLVIEGVVVGDFQNDGINGFFVQQEDGKQDGDSNTSDGIFVFEGPSAVAVAPGNLVRVRGVVAEFDNLTELSSITNVVVCPGSAVASAQTLTFPVASIASLERYEGMLVSIPQPLTVTGNFELGRFGSLDLSVGGRLLQPTQIASPGAAAVAQQSTNDRSRIILDDRGTSQNPNPIPYKDMNNSRRVGDTLPSLTGVLDGRLGIYRIQPTDALSFASSNPRPAPPANPGGRLQVAAANVLNFFTTLDSPDAGAVCGPTGGLDCRGANNPAEFNRQREKLLNELAALSADVVGLMEVENNASVATQSLVDGLNGRLGAGTYAFIDTGTIGTDAIKVAIIYKPSRVSPVGTFALLTTAVDPRFLDTKNRPSLAQTFSELGTGERFTVVVNHLKSKGSDCNDVGDPDLGDGQGNCNHTRTQAAAALLSWMASDPTHSGDPDFLVIGDMNAYPKEDPIATFKTGGLQALLETFVGAGAYSYQFQGQSGYLDHALATATLASQVAGVTEWHNNADEPVVLDYNTEFKTDDPFNIGDPFRASDHDPVVVGLNLSAPAAVPGMNAWQRALLALLILATGLGALSRDLRKRRVTHRPATSAERVGRAARACLRRCTVRT
jgi:predicted extracellular nuclease